VKKDMIILEANEFSDLTAENEKNKTWTTSVKTVSNSQAPMTQPVILAT
jgi:hypothetical protein